METYHRSKGDTEKYYRSKGDITSQSAVGKSIKEGFLLRKTRFLGNCFHVKMKICPNYS